jgi:hypothetical protein
MHGVITAITFSAAFLAFASAQNNVAYGYVGYNCSSPDFTIIQNPGNCLTVTNPSTGLQSSSGLFYQSGCEGEFRMISLLI